MKPIKTTYTLEVFFANNKVHSYDEKLDSIIIAENTIQPHGHAIKLGT